MDRCVRYTAGFLALIVQASWTFGQGDQQALVCVPLKGAMEAALSATYDSRFQYAGALADSMIARDSTSSVWKFIRGVIIWREIYLGGRNEALEAEFRQRMNGLITEGRREVERDPNNTTALFVTGAALGYLGLYHWATGEILRAASEGKEGLSYHERLLALNAQCYDAYLSLGLFNAYASNVPWYVKPLLWILGRSGNEERGIEYLTLTATKGSMARIEAREALSELQIRRHEFDLASASYLDLLKQFPHSTYYALSAVQALFAGKEYSKAAALSASILASTDTSRQTEKDVERMALLIVLESQSYENLGKIGEAIEALVPLQRPRYVRKFDSFRLLSLGRLYWKNGFADKSRDCYERVIAINRHSNHVQEAREQLRAHREMK